MKVSLSPRTDVTSHVIISQRIWLLGFSRRFLATTKEVNPSPISSLQTIFPRLLFSPFPGPPFRTAHAFWHLKLRHSFVIRAWGKGVCAWSTGMVSGVGVPREQVKTFCSDQTSAHHPLPSPIEMRHYLNMIRVCGSSLAVVLVTWQQAGLSST